VAFAVFFLLFALYSSTKTSLYYRVEPASARAQYELNRAAYWLLESPGTPYDWNSTSVVIPGLAQARLVVDEKRLYNLAEMNYSLLKETLGLSGYEFKFELTDANGVIQSASWQGNTTLASFGAVAANAYVVRPMKRVVKYRGQPMTLTLVLSKAVPE